MADIFISYKREQRARVQELVTALLDVGFTVWFDASLSAGESFSDEIDREVRKAKVVIVCWSPGAASSQWVKAEAQIGFGKGNLISALVEGPEGFAPPVPFNSLHHEDLRGEAFAFEVRSEAARSLARRLGQLTGRRDLSDWGALDPSSVHEREQWLRKHGEQGPLAQSLASDFHAADAGKRRRTRRSGERTDRRALLLGAGAVATLGAAGAGAVLVAPNLSRWIPRAEVTALGRSRGVRARADLRLPRGVAALSPNGTLIASCEGGRDPGPMVWLHDVRTGAFLNQPWIDGGATNLAFSPASETFAAISFHGPITILSAAGAIISRAVHEEGFVTRPLFSSDGARLVTCGGLGPPGAGSSARLWDTRTGGQIGVFLHQDTVTAAALSRDGAVVATSSFDDTTRLWDVATGSETSRLSYNANVRHVAFAPDGTLAVAVGSSVLLYRNGVQMRSFDHYQDVREFSFSANGRALLCHGDYASEAFLWRDPLGDAPSAAPIPLAGHDDRVTSAQFSAAGDKVVTTSEDGSAGIWDVAEAALLARLRGHRGEVWDASCDTTLNTIVTTGEDRSALIWKLTYA